MASSKQNAHIKSYRSLATVGYFMIQQHYTAPEVRKEITNGIHDKFQQTLQTSKGDSKQHNRIGFMYRSLRREHGIKNDWHLQEKIHNQVIETCMKNPAKFYGLE